jgi:mannose-6-phosphate isomerase-like protein (cupin superfamily)
MKNIMTELENKKIFERPWGTFEIFATAPNYQVKRLTVFPQGKLSLQSHKHRSEHWVVVHGKAKVINGENILVLYANQSTFIPVGHIHRLENPGEENLEVIEVQTGDYLGEDDIIRYEDIYNRSESKKALNRA